MEMEEEKFDEEEETKEAKEVQKLEAPVAAMEAEIYELEEGDKYLINFRRKFGSVLVHGDVFNEIKTEFAKTAQEFAE